MHGALVTEGGLHRNTTLGYEDSQALYIKYYQLVCSASIVILMQLGFTFLEVGSVRVHFTKAILTKNMIDMLISGIAYYALGFGIAFGDGTAIGGFAGLSDFFLVRENKSITEIHTSTAGWVYHWSYAATAVTVVAGAIAERTKILAYSVCSAVGATILYPVITHWIWSETGWASSLNANSKIMGVVDDAGGIAVHTCAGLTSLIVCSFVGPRQHRLNRNGVFVKNLEKQNQAFIVFGMFVLWFSWYSFNAGPAILQAGSEPDLIGNIATYTTVCAASSGLSFLLVSLLWEKRTPEPCELSNGILAGLVCSTSGCSRTKPYFGMIIGSVGGALMLCSSKLLRKLKIDDVVDAISVHLVCGTWSALSAPFFLETIRSDKNGQFVSCGILTGCEKGWIQLLSNILVIFLTYIYIAAIMVPVCFCLQRFKILRVDVEAEKKGVDLVEFQGPAYSNKHNASRRGNNRRVVDHSEGNKSDQII